MIGINPPLGQIKWFKRRLSGAEKMENDGWIFLSENRAWDPYEVELVVDLINPLYLYWPDAKFFASNRWIRKQACLYAQHGYVILDLGKKMKVRYGSS